MKIFGVTIPMLEPVHIGTLLPFDFLDGSEVVGVCSQVNVYF
jgi:hypothetical protein